MLTITVYLNTLLDEEGVVKACWEAVAELRTLYGVTVFLEVLDTSLLGIGGLGGSVVIVGDTIIKASDCSFEELKSRVVDAVLKSIAFKSRRGEEALDFMTLTQAPSEFMEVA